MPAGSRLLHTSNLRSLRFFLNLDQPVLERWAMKVRQLKVDFTSRVTQLETGPTLVRRRGRVVGCTCTSTGANSVHPNLAGAEIILHVMRIQNYGS